ncbi:MAG: hypothetical protein M1826_006478 [Phylliscum demangeonii]|nr:MAG: hypothetical protein M1826_006478 [Phylliscum demangeonii]
MSSDSKAIGNVPAKKMLWGGRFTGGLDPVMTAFNQSIHFDKAFYAQDIRGSVAYARAIHHLGILTKDEFEAIRAGFATIENEWASGQFGIVQDDEDIHTANERRLGELIGPQTAGKLHTGRSRNDQVATDMRLWLGDALQETDRLLFLFLEVLVNRAEVEIDHLMPGYTHLQRAQPIRWSQWLLSYAFSFATDRERLRQVFRRINRCPLGAGALAGNAFGIDRDALANELGFDGIIWNSMYAVSDRDFVTETMQWGTMFMQHVSRWAEDLILYASAEFAFVRLADAYSTGSSLMPQKKNPDSLELLRGKSGRVFGQMAGLMYTVKGLPSTYNKDLQESVEPLLDHMATVRDSIKIATGVISTLAVRPEQMRAALSPDMLATDLADYLVRKGVPFRETHHIAGQVVALAEREKTAMDQLSFDQLSAIDGRFGRDVLDCFDFERSVDARSAKGGTSRGRVEEQIKVLRKMITTGVA